MALYQINRLTEEGKAIFSLQFDETENMDDVRCVTNMRTGEIILAIKVTPEFAQKAIKINLKTIKTKKGIWWLWHDGYNYLIARMGDNV